MRDKVVRKPRFEKSNMTRSIKDYEKIYNEIKQWTRYEDSDTSSLKNIVYNMMWDINDLVYHGWEGEALKREVDDLEAVINAVKYIENVLEDVLGITSEEYDVYLENDECGRYKLIDTYKKQ